MCRCISLYAALQSNYRRILTYLSARAAKNHDAGAAAMHQSPAPSGGTPVPATTPASSHSWPANLAQDFAETPLMKNGSLSGLSHAQLQQLEFPLSRHQLQQVY